VRRDMQHALVRHHEHRIPLVGSRVQGPVVLPPNLLPACAIRGRRHAQQEDNGYDAQ